MAEGSNCNDAGNETGENDNPQISMEEIGRQLMAGQSESKSTTTVEFEESVHVSPDDSTNASMLICRFCNCKVMRNSKGIFTKKEMSLPVMTEKYKIGTKPTEEASSDHWLVADMFDFENVGFSKTVDDTVKYLICADCERGPIGWHTISEQDQFYITCDRVKYGDC